MGFDLGLQMNAFVMLYIDVKCVVYRYFNLFIEITIRNSCFGKIPILPSIQLFFFFTKKENIYIIILLFCYIYVTTYIHKLYRQPLIIWFIIENHNELNPVDFFLPGERRGSNPRVVDSQSTALEPLGYVRPKLIGSLCLRSFHFKNEWF